MFFFVLIGRLIVAANVSILVSKVLSVLLLKSRYVYLLHLYECSQEATAAANLGRTVRRFANILNFTARKRLFTRKLCRLLLIRGGCLSEFTPSSDCAVLREKPRKSYSSRLSSPSMLMLKFMAAQLEKD